MIETAVRGQSTSGAGSLHFPHTRRELERVQRELHEDVCAWIVSTAPPVISEREIWAREGLGHA